MWQDNQIFFKLEVFASECVASHYEEDFSIQRSEDGTRNIDMSYDCTWMTRGHTSKMSSGFLIEAKNRLILAHECLRKYCYICAKIKTNYMNNEQMSNEKKMQLTKNQANVNALSKEHQEACRNKWL